MNTLLIAIVALKAVCLIFCWKAVMIARNQSKQPSSDFKNLESKMSKLIEENEILTKQLNEIKKKKSS